MKTDSLVIETSIDNTKLKKGLAEATSKVKDTSVEMVKGVQTALTAFGSYLAVNFIKNTVSGFVSAGVSLNNLSKNVSANIEDVGALQKGIEKAGGSASDFANTISSLQREIDQLKTSGNLPLAGKFKFFNLELKQSTTAMDTILQLADRLGKAKDDSERRGIGAYWNMSPETVRYLSQGRAAVEADMAKQKAQGLMTQKQADMAVAANAKLVEFKQNITNLTNDISTHMIPILDDFAHRFTNALTIVKTELGITTDDLSKFILGAAGLLTVVTGINGIRLAFVGLAAILNPISITLAAIVASLYAIKSLKDSFKSLEVRKTVRGWMGLDNSSILPNRKDADYPNAPSANSGNITQPPMMSQFNSQGRVNPISNITSSIFNYIHGMLENAKNEPIGYKFKKNPNGSFARDAQGKMIYDRDAQGNKIPEAYGKYQITPATATKTMGRNVSGEELLNPEFNEQVHDKIMAQLLQKHNGNMLAAVAEYNGSGKQYQQTGQSDYTNKFMKIAKPFIDAGIALTSPAGTIKAESPVMQQSAAKYANPIGSGASNSSNKSVNNSINVAALHLPNAKDADGFVKELSDYSSTAWAFSNPWLT